MKQAQMMVARQLRVDNGLSVKAIAQRVGVSVSSVSRWVKDIELTEEQQTRLIQRSLDSVKLIRARQVRSELCLAARRGAQEEGRAQARLRDPDHMAGCVLYWAEGSKKANKGRPGARERASSSNTGSAALRSQRPVSRSISLGLLRSTAGSQAPNGRGKIRRIGSSPHG